eukprot:Plantae.Rhodophyta-Rhodochaete_pulchella.ctg1868.p1 GENE.Plantae.Rhodophyta-Rhodochaete_pulchella.ctg1868~~Plantae.Rhodophyta-Rhodochaete_pulchella.ctg1868.p1  ORF type:complete len:243 (-),score=58.89 Plantae.Rhodophyta-Rhodochaete_pulchella.ctg1868:117-845(-)
METSSTAPLEGPVKKLFYWRNVKVTGAVFAAGNLLFIMTLFFRYSLLSFFSLMCLFVLGGALAYVNGSKLAVGFRGERTVPKPTLGQQYISRALVESKLGGFIDNTNWLIDEGKKIVFAVDNAMTVKAIAVLFGLVIIGSLFSDMFILYVLFLSSFIGPIVYEKNQKEIDDTIERGRKIADAKLTEGRQMAGAKMNEFKHIAGEKASVARAAIAEKATPFLEKNPKAREIAAKVGIEAKKTE